MEIIAVILIVVMAGIYLARRLYKGLKSGPSCGCGTCGRDCVAQNLPCHPEESEHPSGKDMDHKIG